MGKRSYYAVAIHLFIIKDKQILLIRRYNTGYEDGKYSVVAGHVESGESVTEAGIREALEEAGITITPMDIKICGVMHRKSEDERIDFFACVDNWQGEIENKEPHKCDEFRWVSTDSLPDNIIPYIKQALELTKSNTSIWYDEFGWK